MFWEPSNRDDAGRARRRRAGAGTREDDERVADADADDADATDGDGRTNMTRARVREWEWGLKWEKARGFDDGFNTRAFPRPRRRLIRRREIVLERHRWWRRGVGNFAPTLELVRDALEVGDAHGVAFAGTWSVALRERLF